MSCGMNNPGSRYSQWKCPECVWQVEEEPEASVARFEGVEGVGNQVTEVKEVQTTRACWALLKALDSLRVMWKAFGSV